MTDEEKLATMRTLSVAGTMYQRHDLSYWDCLDLLKQYGTYVAQQFREEKTDEEITGQVLSLAKHHCSHECGKRPMEG